MAEFFLEKKPTDPATYRVHSLTCSSASENDQSRYLGSYAIATAAFDKAVGLFSGVDYCPDCLPH